MSRPQLYLLLLLLALAVQAFFAMSEMALVSFHKLRLEYYASLGNKRAIWLTRLLRKPTILFGTTLIGVNTALQFGSQCSRELYESVGLSADWAPLSQVLLVLLLGEITPMFVGRKYAEHAALLSAPVIYAFSRIFLPFIWMLDWICTKIQQGLQKGFGGAGHGSGLQFSREELQRIFEEREGSGERRAPWNAIASRIFLLRGLFARDLMLPIGSFRLLPEGALVGEVRAASSSLEAPFFLLYASEIANIKAILYPTDLIGAEDDERAQRYAETPWFLSENVTIMQVLKEMRRSRQTVAMVLGTEGQVRGLITLDEVIDAIFGRIDDWVTLTHPQALHAVSRSPAIAAHATRQIVVDRTFPSALPLAQFEKECGLSLLTAEEQMRHMGATLEGIMRTLLGREAEPGESVRLTSFQLTMTQASLLAPKLIRVHTL